MINHQPDRDREQTRANARAITTAYRAIWSQLQEIRSFERYRDKQALKDSGILAHV